MRFSPFLLLLVLLAFGPAASAQSSATASAPAAAPDSGAVLLFNNWYLPRYAPKAAEADTTGALLSLFRKRRYAGWLYTIPFIAGMTLALPISTTDAYGQTTVADEAVSPPLGSALVAGTIVGFILHASKFNRAHLVAVDKAYAAGQPIPARYRSQLNASHFQEAAYLREALRQQMEREQRQPAGTSGR
ncbi:hypothetical protein [Hymenobacter cellulosilyticus]|uniref:DUF4231 domain-containing protein n=1 Tax=Hymenobacter cellulosilyticus TaxID=2932248 RepID=A0A8T9Q8Z6_9BACT|nr:hypothetical protein [Hymenobacter cellulosilyticus]UOQ74017.1 hypothetical protein MUN79_09045 [Hymenobacter cellulosilyticus]